MKILTSCNNFLTKNRKNILYLLGFIFVFFILSDFSFASNTNVSDTNPDNKNFWISLLNGILKNLAALLGFLTFLVGMFLSPEWTSGSIVGLWGSEWALKQMWIMMSNVVYFIFALIFIWIAFMNIIGKDADTYGLKSAMPRFIVWVLIVPFTWFLVQFILSISSILTIWVLSLPYDTFKDTYMKDKDLEKVEFCKDWIINTGTQAKDKKIMECKDKSATTNLKDILNPEKSESLFGIINIYTYGIMSVDGNGKVYSGNLVVDGIGNLFDLWIKVLFDLIFVIVYLLLMIALGLALFVRWVYLWFYAMLSPVFWLLYFFKKQNEGMGDAGKKFNLKEFIALAFVPVYVSAALAFWLLFLFAAGNSWGGTDSKIISDGGKKVEYAGMTYTIKWAATNDGDAKSSIKKLFAWFQWTFGTLILQVFWLAILWIAVMAALKSSEVTSNVSAPFADFWDKIWQLAMKAPTYAPIIPTGSGFTSAQWLSKVWSTLSNIPETRLNSQMADTLSKIQTTFWGGNTVNPATKAEVNRILTNGIDDKTELDNLRKIYLEQVEKYGTNDRNVQELRKQILEAMKTAKWSAETDLKNHWIADLSKIDTTNLKDQTANLALIWKWVWAINEANKLSTATMPWMITWLVPWSWNNTNTQSSSTLPPTIVKDNTDPSKYQVWNTTINIQNNWANLTSDNITKIATALKDVEKSKIDDTLSTMWIKDKETIRKIQDGVDKITPEKKS